MWEVYYTCSSIGPVDLVLHAGSLGSIVFNSPADSGPAPVSLFNTRVDCTTTAPTITPTPTGFSPVVAEGTGTPTSRQRIAE
jgi:hypothetical protein